MKSIYKIPNYQTKEAFKKIRLIALDFDGVLTDDRVISFQDGTEAIIRSRADSLGIDLLNDAGLYDKKNYKKNSKEIDIVILSRETNPVVASVAKKIKIKCTQSLYKKLGALKEEIEKRGLAKSEVIFIGNDLNDLECIKYAGIGIAVNDAIKAIKDIADYITNAPGGKGAFREVCELILSAHDKDHIITKNNKDNTA